MTHSDPDRLLDDLFHALAPDERPADPAFVARIELKIAELERYRLWRSRMVRRLVADGLAIAAVGTAVAFVSMTPAGTVELPAEPGLLSAGTIVMLLCWLGATAGKPRLLT